MNKKAVVEISIILFLLITACSGSESTGIIEILPEPTLKSALILSVTSTPVSTPTSALLPTISATEKPSNTPIPASTSTPEPIATLTITPVPPITNRQPSISELENYLTELSLEEERFGHVIEVVYEVDLVVSDYLFVGIFIWQDDHYTGSFIYQGYPWKYDPGSRVTLEDWTNDDIPEVIFDFRDDTGGTGVRVTYWTRYVIHCQKNKSTCKVVWAGRLGSLYEGYGSGGVSLLQADVNRVSYGDKPPTLELITESFAIYSVEPYSSQIGEGILSYDGGRKIEEGYSPYYPRESLKVYTSTLEIFSWNGTEFEWQETNMLKPVAYIDSRAVLEATSSDDQKASISARPNIDATFSNDICQLLVDDNVTGLPFGCRDNFTIVEWLDVTGDEKEELVIIAYSGVYSYVEFDEGEYLGLDKDCIHQRVIIYQQENAQMKQIANVTGCVVKSDLYGISIEDIDDDGQVEILAASGWFTGSRCSSVFSASGPADGQQKNCWYEFGYQNEIYKWNGSEFIYRGIKE